MKKLTVLLALAVLAAAAVFFIRNRSGADTAGGEEVVPDVVDYNFHIRPIFSDKCFKCHGPDANKRQAGLRLDTEEGAYAALKDHPGRHVIVPGNPDASELFLRISTTDTSMVMPPADSKLPPLTEFEQKLVRKWIKQGAHYKPHWAFTPPEKPEIPSVKNASWPQNDIDRFVLAKMESKGLQPNSEADRERLLKRVSLDIVGLPPSIELQDRFLNDGSPDAYEKIVDELLKMPQYGEKMAVHWLDVARYADSHGYQDDGYRTMWPWRDWVIHAFNQNYPYDKFVTWQLAGDLMPNASKEMLLATGFNRNHKITQEGGVIDEEYRIEYVTDRTNTFGKAFLGLTFECAKCHDHKYDPISQKDYFSTFAFFNQVPEKGLVGDISLASLADPPRISISSEEVRNELTFINKKDSARVAVMVMKDSSGIRPTRILKRGAYDNPGDTVHCTPPTAIMTFDTNRFAQNRLGLAMWLTDKKNPLTARVFVNRIWQEIMGRGLVKTSGDFGMQGELPSHPELLDWLSVDFMESGWDIKRLVKNIVMSATYRQSAEVTPDKLAKDPENMFYSRSPRHRIAAELVRDLVLESSGLLNKEIGGPSVKPYQPKGIWENSTSGRGELARYVQDHGDKLYRRGMYFFIKRTVPPPVMLMFDASNRDQCEVRRITTNTPLQALVLLNDPQVLEASRVFAERLCKDTAPVDEKIATAFRRIVCRKIRPDELKILQQYYQEGLQQFADTQKAAKYLKVGEFPRENISDQTSLASLMQVIHTIYNMEEATTRS